MFEVQNCAKLRVDMTDLCAHYCQQLVGVVQGVMYCCLLCMSESDLQMGLLTQWITSLDLHVRVTVRVRVYGRDRQVYRRATCK